MDLVQVDFRDAQAYETALEGILKSTFSHAQGVRHEFGSNQLGFVGSLQELTKQGLGAARVVDFSGIRQVYPSSQRSLEGGGKIVVGVAAYEVPEAVVSPGPGS